MSEDDDLEGRYVMGDIAAQDQYGEPSARIVVRPPAPYNPDYREPDFPLPDVAADRLMRPQPYFGSEAPQGALDAVKAVPEALGIPDAYRALRGDMTEQEARDFAFTAALGVLPGAKGAKAVKGAARAAGGLGFLAPAERVPKMGSIAAPLQFWEHAGDLSRLPTKRMASPGEINEAAAESRQGMTQPQLRDLYGELGLTGGEPLPIAKPSLEQVIPEDVRQAAIALKLEDRAALNRLTPQQRQTYHIKQELPAGVMLPSTEVARPALEAFQPVKKEVMRAEKAFDLKPPPQLFDVSSRTLRQVPDVPQFNLPRVAPNPTERLGTVSQGGLQRIERAAAAAPESNWGWYNLMQARDLFHQIHGPERGEQAFNVWLDGVAGTSMVNPIDNNVRSSTWYLQQVLQGKPLPETIPIVDPVTGKTVRTLAGGPPPGYGAKSQIQHADRVLEYLTRTYDPVNNPKPISYRMNLGGNWMPRTVDTHDIRNMVGMPYGKSAVFGENSGLLPGEYSYLEGVGQRAADRASSTQAAQQAATWVGGGKYTGLKSYPAPLMEVINRRAHVTGMVRGISAEQALREAFSGKRPLLNIAGATAIGAGGASQMGGVAATDQYEQY